MNKHDTIQNVKQLYKDKEGLNLISLQYDGNKLENYESIQTIPEYETISATCTLMGGALSLASLLESGNEAEHADITNIYENQGLGPYRYPEYSNGLMRYGSMKFTFNDHHNNILRFELKTYTNLILPKSIRFYPTETASFGCIERNIDKLYDAITMTTKYDSLNVMFDVNGVIIISRISKNGQSKEGRIYKQLCYPLYIFHKLQTRLNMFPNYDPSKSRLVTYISTCSAKGDKPDYLIGLKFLIRSSLCNDVLLAVKDWDRLARILKIVSEYRERFQYKHIAELCAVACQISDNGSKERTESFLKNSIAQKGLADSNDKNIEEVNNIGSNNLYTKTLEAFLRNEQSGRSRRLDEIFNKMNELVTGYDICQFVAAALNIKDAKVSACEELVWRDLDRLLGSGFKKKYIPYDVALQVKADMRARMKKSFYKSWINCDKNNKNILQDNRDD
eukprot:532613_1